MALEGVLIPPTLDSNHMVQSISKGRKRIGIDDEAGSYRRVPSIKHTKGPDSD